MAGFLGGTLVLDSYPVTTAMGDNDDVVVEGSLVFVTVSNDNDAITGIINPAPAQGSLILVANIGPTNTLVIKNNDAGSSAGNKIFTANGSDLNVEPFETVALGYDSLNLEWHVVKFVG